MKNHNKTKYLPVPESKMLVYLTLLTLDRWNHIVLTYCNYKIKKHWAENVIKMILFVYFDKDIFTILTISIVIFFQPNNKRLHKTNKVVNVRNILHKSFYCFICIARLKDYSNKKGQSCRKIVCIFIKTNRIDRLQQQKNSQNCK